MTIIHDYLRLLGTCSARMDGSWHDCIHLQLRNSRVNRLRELRERVNAMGPVLGIHKADLPRYGFISVASELLGLQQHELRSKVERVQHVQSLFSKAPRLCFCECGLQDWCRPTRCGSA